MEERRGISARHTFAIALAVVIGSLFIWVVHLARQGDPVGYIILTGAGVLLSLLVFGVVLRLVLAGANRPPRHHPEMKTVYDTQRVLAQQNRALLDQLDRLQKNGSLLPAETGGIELQPGQMMTAEGYVIDSAAFEVLEEE